jgi:hypothetical protein
MFQIMSYVTDAQYGAKDMDILVRPQSSWSLLVALKRVVVFDVKGNVCYRSNAPCYQQLDRQER